MGFLAFAGTAYSYDESKEKGILEYVKEHGI